MLRSIEQVKSRDYDDTPAVASISQRMTVDN